MDFIQREQELNNSFQAILGSLNELAKFLDFNSYNVEKTKIFVTPKKFLNLFYKEQLERQAKFFHSQFKVTM